MGEVFSGFFPGAPAKAELIQGFEGLHCHTGPHRKLLLGPPQGRLHRKANFLAKELAPGQGLYFFITVRMRLPCFTVTGTPLRNQGQSHTPEPGLSRTSIPTYLQPESSV